MNDLRILKPNDDHAPLKAVSPTGSQRTVTLVCALPDFPQSIFTGHVPDFTFDRTPHVHVIFAPVFAPRPEAVDFFVDQKTPIVQRAFGDTTTVTLALSPRRYLARALGNAHRSGSRRHEHGCEHHGEDEDQ